VSKHQTPQRQLAEEERRESAARCALEQLVALLMAAASDTWHNTKLRGRDRALHRGRGDTLLATVDRLSKVILDHSDAGVRADRLIDIHDALEAAAILADGLKVPIAHRLRTAAATEKNREQAPRTAEIIEDEFNKLREKYPNKDFKKDGPWKTARFLYQSVKQRREQEGLSKLETDTIGRYLAKLPFFSD
jgi:hypothetical protein